MLGLTFHILFKKKFLHVICKNTNLDQFQIKSRQIQFLKYLGFWGSYNFIVQILIEILDFLFLKINHSIVIYVNIFIRLLNYVLSNDIAQNFTVSLYFEMRSASWIIFVCICSLYYLSTEAHSEFTNIGTVFKNWETSAIRNCYISMRVATKLHPFCTSA